MTKESISLLLITRQPIYAIKPITNNSKVLVMTSTVIFVLDFVTELAKSKVEKVIRINSDSMLEVSNLTSESTQLQKLSKRYFVACGIQAITIV
jgi:hypothetical protein